MAETLAPAQPAPSSYHPDHHFMTPPSWREWVVLLVLLTVVGIGGFMIGLSSRTQALNDARKQTTSMQKISQSLREAYQEQEDSKKALSDQLTAIQNQIRDIFNSYRTIGLKGNETISVASGYFTVGLVGQPANEKITINVNGNQQTVAVGDSVDVGTSSCRVEVRSFDMFKATLVTSCTPVKP